MMKITVIITVIIYSSKSGATAFEWHHRQAHTSINRILRTYIPNGEHIYAVEVVYDHLLSKALGCLLRLHNSLRNPVYRGAINCVIFTVISN